ncbi:MAG TPA: discoidin domain-containing protein [Anaerolineales bacterium]|nr:discoidin domain-containing protein [Anaerolineales bacterium]
MKANPSPHDQEIINLLESLGSQRAEYPQELLAARRAAFIAQIQQKQANNNGEAKQQVQAPSGMGFTKRLRELGSVQDEYPQELLAARRAAFIAQVEQRTAVPVSESAKVQEEITSRDQVLLGLFKSIKSAEITVYPTGMMAARRAAFKRQIALGGRIGLLETLRTALQRFSFENIKLPSLPLPNMMRTSMVVALLMVIAYLGSLVRTREPIAQQAPAGQDGVAQQVPVFATGTEEVPKVICKPGYLPPLCLAKEFEPSQDLTYQGNGVARPAVAKDTVPGYDGVHDAAYINDGLYGPGSSWISNSAYSWIKIDLGKPTAINTVTFGRDRLGHLQSGDPGQFVIAVALSDNVYADGNSNNDYVEYTQVYHSLEDGFNGRISGSQTVRVDFGPVTARYVKIIFANPGTAVDEVEVFMVQPTVVDENPTRKPKDDEPPATATSVPTDTPLPTSTPTSVPTDTPVPTDTSTPRPTNTPTPRPTNTPTDIPPTNTPRPTNTPLPEPTNTEAPVDTPVPPDTPISEPTDTHEPFVAPTENSSLTGVP